MSLSIVTLSKNIENLSACIAAIRRHEPDLDPKRIIVVNDDDTNRIALEFHQQVTVLGGRKPFVFAANANVGLAHAFEVHGSDVAVLLNDDAQLETPCGFTKLAELTAKHTDHGIISAVTNSVGNPAQMRRVGPPLLRSERRMLCFIAVAIHRRAWDAVGGLDEDFTGYGWEDNAYCEAVKHAGLKLGIWNGCFVDHKKLRSTFRTMPTNADDFAKARQIFIEKWGEAAAR